MKTSSERYRCYVCGSELSVRDNSNANLIRYFKLRHLVIYQAELQEREKEIHREEVAFDRNLEAVLRRRHPPSWIWKYFQKLSKHRYCCDLWGAILSIKSVKNSNNLSRHFRTKHVIVYKNMINKRDKFQFEYDSKVELGSTQEIIVMNQNLSNTKYTETIETKTEIVNYGDKDEVTSTGCVNPKRRSWIWKYFEKVAPRLYQCIMCKREIVYKRNYSNMYRHVKLIHRDVFEEEIEEKHRSKIKQVEGVFVTEKLDDVTKASGSSKRRRSWIWKYYVKMSVSRFRCDLCGRILNVKYPHHTNNLKRHYKFKHPNIYRAELKEIKFGFMKNIQKNKEECGLTTPTEHVGASNEESPNIEDNEIQLEVETESITTVEIKSVEEQNLSSIEEVENVEKEEIVSFYDENDGESSEQKKKRPRSWIWDYFKKINNAQYRCNVCMTVLTIKSRQNNTNMNRHYRLKHPVLYKSLVKLSHERNLNYKEVITELIDVAESSSVGDQSSESAIPRKRSWIWKYFVKLTQHHYRCTLCNAVLSIITHTTNMNRHMKFKHFDIYKAEVEDKPNSNCNNVDGEKKVNVYPDKELSHKNENDTLDVVKDTTSINCPSSHETEFEQSSEEEEEMDEQNWVWKYFENLTTSHYQCGVCGKVLNGSNKLRRHIKIKHFILYESALSKTSVEYSSNPEREDKVKAVSVEEAEETQPEVINIGVIDEYESETVATDTVLEGAAEKIQIDSQYSNTDDTDSMDLCIIVAEDEQEPEQTWTRKRSWVWKYFVKLNSGYYRCSLCNSVLSINTYTYNMNRHVKVKHPDIYKMEVEEKQNSANTDGVEEAVVVEAIKKDESCTDTPNKDVTESLPIKTTRGQRRSWVWNYFQRLNTCQYRCDLCAKVMTGVNNLNRHIRIKHNTLYKLARRRTKVNYNTRKERKKVVKTAKVEIAEDNNIKNLYPNMEKADEIDLFIAEDPRERDTSWIWLLIDSTHDEFYFCQICRFQFVKLTSEEENVINILDHMGNEHELMSADQVTIREDD